MTPPDADLTRIYGNEKAGAMPLPLRLVNAILQQQLARRAIDRQREARSQDALRSDAVRALAAMELMQANDRLRHTRPPVLLEAGPEGSPLPMLSGGAVPLGLDEGMVRLASVVGAGADLAHLEKNGGLMNMLAKGPAGQALGNVGQRIAGGAAGLGKRIASGLGSAVKSPSLAAPLSGAVAGKTPAPSVPSFKSSVPKTMGGVNPTLVEAHQTAEQFSSLPSHAQSALQNSDLVRSGVPAPIAAQLARASAAPGESMTDAVMRHAKTPIPKSSVAPTLPMTPAAPSAPVTAPSPKAAPAAAAAAPSPTPRAQPEAPAAAQAPGALQRIGQDLGGGQWKWKVPMLAAGALGAYGAYKGLKAGLGYMSEEAHPQRFNQGAPQLSYGVNEYGYPQLGTPMQ